MSVLEAAGAAGATRLHDGAAELGSGLGKLTDGSSPSLAQQLSEGVTSIPDVTDSQPR